MPNVLERLPNGARVLVIRLRSLGDCVLTTPAIHILKNHRPDLRIAVAVEPRFAPVFADNPDIDELTEPRAAAAARWRAKLALNLHGGTRSMVLTAASGAGLRAGFAHFRGQALYNVPIPRAQEILGIERKVHTAEHLASAIFHLGAPQCEIPRARLFANETAQRAPYAVLHPMASAPSKTWPAERFLAIAGQLRERWELEPVFIAGPGEDVSAFTGFEVIAGAPLDRVKSLLRGASLFVGNDSGPAHMAAAFGLPLLVLFGSSDPEVWAPWRTTAEVLIAPGGDVRGIRQADALQALERLRVRA